MTPITRRRAARSLRAALLASTLVLLAGGCATDPSAPADQDTTDVTVADTSTPDTNTPDTGQDTATDTASPVIPPDEDADNDTITNGDEGSDTERDTDGDGTPDYLDLDSDDDGVPDRDEAGDQNRLTRPVDSDGDGTPDFVDDDSDGNGILDRHEGTADLDGDGKPDRIDTDDDGDNLPDVLEIAGLGADCDRNGIADPAGLPAAPRDCDLDGTPDFQSIDSDADTIPDLREGTRDTDGDGWFDRYDRDSDNDGYTDAEEAGDDDLATAPIDSDQDSIPDYRDPDSDDDGVSDADERANPALDHLDPDSDDDGATDLVEIVAGTDPGDATDHPRARGDYIFLVPFEQPTTPTRDTVPFNTSVRQLDVYLNFDTTTSMFAELQAMGDLTDGLPGVVDALTCDTLGVTCERDRDCPADAVCRDDGQCVTDPLAGTDVCVPDVWTGVGAFDELDTYRNLLAMQASAVATANAIPGTRQGVDEAPSQAVSCVANRNHCNNGGLINCGNTGVGCPAMRNGAIRVLVHVSDADEQCTDMGSGRCSQFTPQFAGSQLADRKIRFIGLYGSDDDSANPGTPADLMTAVATAAGSLDAMGLPFVYEAIDADVVPNLLAALREIVVGVPVELTIDVVDVAGDGFDASRFIDHIEVNVSGTGDCSVQSDTVDSSGDGFDDTFSALLPGTPVCFDVVPIAVNDIAEATSEPRMLRATLEVRGDSSTVDRRDIFFLVPPLPLVFN